VKTVPLDWKTKTQVNAQFTIHSALLGIQKVNAFNSKNLRKSAYLRAKLTSENFFDEHATRNHEFSKKENQDTESN